MTVQAIDPKEEQARYIALCILEDGETRKTFEEVAVFWPWALYEWLNIWGFSWDEREGEWIQNDKT